MNSFRLLADLLEAGAETSAVDELTRKRLAAIARSLAPSYRERLAIRDQAIRECFHQFYPYRSDRAPAIRKFTSEYGTYQSSARAKRDALGDAGCPPEYRDSPKEFFLAILRTELGIPGTDAADKRNQVRQIENILNGKS